MDVRGQVAPLQDLERQLGEQSVDTESAHVSQSVLWLVATISTKVLDPVAPPHVTIEQRL